MSPSFKNIVESQMRKNHLAKQVSTLATLVFFSGIAYYFLLHENFMHSAISCIISYSHTLTMKKHLVVLGLLPIYIAMMIFGAAMLGIYLGNKLECVIKRKF